MEDRQTTLRKKLEALLKEAAELDVELSREEGAVSDTSHYSVIEARAHELGRQFSRQVQQRQMGETAARTPRRLKCPDCGTACDVREKKRRITSIDGPVQLPEPAAHCPSCRRDFFPSA